MPTEVAKAGPSAPWSTSRRSSCSARCRSVRPTRIDSRSLPSAWSAISAPIRRQEISSSSLITRNCSTAPPRSASAARCRRADQPVPGHGEVVLDRQGVGALGDGCVGGGDRRVAPGARQHLHAQRLVGTPLVGLAARRSAAEQQVPSAAPPGGRHRAAAREVPHVGRAGDERRRAAARRAALPKPLASRRVPDVDRAYERRRDVAVAKRGRMGGRRSPVRGRHRGRGRGLVPRLRSAGPTGGAT